MGLLRTIFRHSKAQPAPREDLLRPICSHLVLLPQWDSAEDMGNPAKVVSYTCVSCYLTFSRMEGERLMARQQR